MLYLASGSPRRRELLTQIGVPFQLLKVNVDESLRLGEAPLEYVQRLAAEKARAGFEVVLHDGLASAPVLGADTSVVIDGMILGKPANRRESIDILLALSGRSHDVITAIALATPLGVKVTHSRTEVNFRTISEEEAGAYWDTGEPADKAGAYGIQGLGAVFVERIKGSYTGVVGLPLFETARLLQEAGVPVWQTVETES